MKSKITVHQFIDELSAVLQEYFEEKSFYKNPVISIGHDKGDMAVEIHEANKKKYLFDGKEYAINDLCVSDELGVELPNYEALERIAKEWIAEE